MSAVAVPSCAPTHWRSGHPACSHRVRTVTSGRVEDAVQPLAPNEIVVCPSSSRRSTATQAFACAAKRSALRHTRGLRNHQRHEARSSEAPAKSGRIPTTLMRGRGVAAIVIDADARSAVGADTDPVVWRLNISREAYNTATRRPRAPSLTVPSPLTASRHRHRRGLREAATVVAFARARACGSGHAVDGDIRTVPGDAAVGR